MSQNILPKRSQNKSAEFLRYSTLLFEVFSDREAKG
jgi:hypothetical protein